MEIRELKSPVELEEGYVVLKELRQTLTFQDFTALYEQAKKHDNYTLVGVYLQGSCVAVMGYRVLYDFVHGKHLYIDDLVVTDKIRSQGIGAKLLKWAEDLASELQCKGLRLCTGVENEAGKRFYKREGWNPRALAFKKQLPASDLPG
jgi:GNAT superfamily N-acetyltransferase